MKNSLKLSSDLSAWSEAFRKQMFCSPGTPVLLQSLILCFVSLNQYFRYQSLYLCFLEDNWRKIVSFHNLQITAYFTFWDICTRITLAHRNLGEIITESKFQINQYFSLNHFFDLIDAFQRYQRSSFPRRVLTVTIKPITYHLFSLYHLVSLD